jgi:DeoR/GlpR family transcriptional regulator of sugar metabolism
MLRVARQAKILQLINERGFVENEELARLFAVTQTTIRRDLKALSQQQLIKLDHGGSFSKDLLDNGVEPLYETKLFLNRETKRAIGAAAAGMVTDGDVVILDSGTTNAQIAYCLKRAGLKNVTVVTCDLMVAKELCPEPNITVVMLGGVLRKYYYSAYGPFTENILRNLTARKAFLGIDAADKASGIWNLVLEEVPIKQLMIRNSDQVIMVGDSSKFGKSALYKVCPWEEIDHVITDDCISDEYRGFFDQQNIKLRLVSTPAGGCDEVPAQP